jgi:alpha-L-fucosidase
MNLTDIVKEIREIITQKQIEFGLSFEEENHIYTMNGRTDYPSVSKVLKKFYTEFPVEEASYNKAKGDPIKQQELIEEWAAAGSYSTNMGSRVHFVLESELIKRNGNYKQVRQPEFNCDLLTIVILVDVCADIFESATTFVPILCW